MDSQPIMGRELMKLTLEKLTEEVLLNEEERKEIESILNRSQKSNNGLKKLLNIHDALVHSSLFGPIVTATEYLKAVQDNMAQARVYMNIDREDMVTIEFPTEFSPGRTEEMHHSVAVLYDKKNGVPDRMSMMQKNLFDTSHELITYFHLHKKHSNDSSHEELENETGYSYADKAGFKKRKRN